MSIKLFMKNMKWLNHDEETLRSCKSLKKIQTSTIVLFLDVTKTTISQMLLHKKMFIYVPRGAIMPIGIFLFLFN